MRTYTGTASTLSKRMTTMCSGQLRIRQDPWRWVGGAQQMCHACYARHYAHQILFGAAGSSMSLKIQGQLYRLAPFSGAPGMSHANWTTLT